MKVKVTEKEFTKTVIAYAKLRGWRVAHFRPALVRAMGHKPKYITPVQGDGKGFPDLILLRDDEAIVAELKVGKGKTTPEQDVWLDAFEAASIIAYIWTPDDWGQIERALS